MPWKKRSTKKSKRTYKRRRVAKRSNLGGALYTKKKLVSSVTAAGTVSAMSFTVADVPDNKALADYFDQYCITGIKVQFFPQETVNAPAGTNNFVVPTISWVVDQTDASTSWSETDLLMCDGVKTRLFNKPLSVYVPVRPQLTTPTGTEMIQTRKKAVWLATQNTSSSIDSTPHLGLKYFVSNAGSSQPSYYRVLTTYYVAFRSPKSGNA